MKRERGNADLYVALAILIALGAMFGGFAWWLSREKAAAFDAGKAEVQGEWDAAKIEAARLKAKADEEISKGLGVLAAQVAAANDRADQAESQAKEDRRANRGKQLVACEGEESPGPDAGGGRGIALQGSGGVGAGSAGRGVVPPGGAGDHRSGPHLLWRFVGLHDGGFTGLDGEPLFAASRGYALDPARADAASPYNLADALDVISDNAFKLSACRRDVAKARAVVQVAADAWEKVQH